ncbi:ricin-type beta-trefoil lectin domain protein [Actinomadura rugatobispora]|uniref:Ricin-type beta-trefoil lectin domain protein n=1 Tax=Actinomadura rugatobispora TaxID=1994 RepID=A0ABW0ZPN0_9ACTN|nr:hypothetical protein GCM10010200_094080 [Actinomadura rugatobispora]
MSVSRSFRAAARWLAPIAAAPLIAIMTGGPAHAQPFQPNAKFIARTQHPAARCLDADLGTVGHLVTKVQLWDCNYQIQQNWNTGAWSNNTLGIWSSVSPFWCLDALPYGGNGTIVELRGCNGGLGQQWLVRGSSQPFRIVHVPTDRCLEAAAATVNANGSRMQLWDCNGQPHQGWWVTYVATPVG